MINHRGGILIFGQILSKSKILDFRVKDLKFCDFAKFWILGLRTSNFVISSEFSSNLFNFDQKLKFCGLGLRISNFARVKDFKFWFSLGLRISNFTNLPKSKFYKNHQILSKKFLISQILWVLGYQNNGKIAFLAQLGRDAPSRAIWVAPTQPRFPTKNFSKSWKSNRFWTSTLIYKSTISLELVTGNNFSKAQW